MASNKLLPKTTILETKKNESSLSPENKANVFEELLNVCGDDEVMAELIAEVMAEENNREMKQAPKKKSPRNPVKLVTKPSSKKVVKTVSKTGIKPVISGKQTISKVKTGTNCAANAVSKSVKVSSRTSLNKAPVHTVKKFSVESPNSHPTLKAISAATVKPIRKVTFAENIITAGLSESVKISGKQKNFKEMNISKIAPENIPNVFEELLNVCGDDELMAELIAEVMAEENNQEMKQAPKKKSPRNPVKLVTKPSSMKVIKTISKTGIKPIISGEKTISKIKIRTDCAANASSKSSKDSSMASLNKAPVHTVKKISVESTNSQPTSKAISATTVKASQEIIVAKNIITAPENKPNVFEELLNVCGDDEVMSELIAEENNQEKKQASPSKKGPPVTAKRTNLSGTIMKKVMNTIPIKLIASKPTTAPPVKSVLRGTEKQTKLSETGKGTSPLSPFSMDTSATYIIQKDYSPMLENEDEEHTLPRYGSGKMDFNGLEIINEYIQVIDSKITTEDVEKARNSICL